MASWGLCFLKSSPGDADAQKVEMIYNPAFLSKNSGVSTSLCIFPVNFNLFSFLVYFIKIQSKKGEGTQGHWQKCDDCWWERGVRGLNGNGKNIIKIKFKR